MKVNITLETDKGSITFYTIDAIGPNIDTKTNEKFDSVVYSNGIEFKCIKSLPDLWNKLNVIRTQNENNK